jgi:hypothetical protein
MTGALDGPRNATKVAGARLAPACAAVSSPFNPNPKKGNAMNRRLALASFALCTVLAAALPRVAQDAGKKKQAAPPLPGAGTGGATPHATTSTVIGPNRNEGSRVTVTYGRPFLVHPRKGGESRKAWGGDLAPWDKPYRLGADEATTILTQHPIEIAGTMIPAGIHTLYMIPSATGASKLAFSKKVGDWGVPVNVDHDVGRFDLTKSDLEQNVDQLTIAVENTTPAAFGGTLRIRWEKTQFSLPFTVKK